MYAYVCLYGCLNVCRPMQLCKHACMHIYVYTGLQSQTGVVTLNYTNRFSWFRHIIRVRMMSLGIEGADEAENRYIGSRGIVDRG